MLRCRPANDSPSSMGSSTTLINSNSSTSSEDSTRPIKAHRVRDFDGIIGQVRNIDGASICKTKNKPKFNPKPTVKAQRQPFGLDGFWDDPQLPVSPTDKPKKESHDSWDNWGKPPSPAGSSDSKAWGNWGKPPPPKEEPKTGTLEMTGGNSGVYHPFKGSDKAASISGSQTGSCHESQWAQPKKDPVGMTTAATGDHPDSSESKRPGSKAGSQTSPQKGSEKNQKTASQPTSTSVHLRGGGASNRSVRTRHSSGRGSPLVVNNSIVYNGVGTPPPLSNGPPPPRTFWKRMDAVQAGKDAQKAAPKNASTIDPWDNLPAYDITKDPTANTESNLKDKVDSWDVGETAMPGSWNTPAADQNKNNNGWGTFAQGKNDPWSNTVETISSASEKNANGKDTFGDADNATSWDWPKVESQEQNGSSSGSNGRVSDNGNGNAWETMDNTAARQGDGWGTDNTTTNQPANAWGTNAPAPATGTTATEPKIASIKGSKAGSVGKPASLNKKAEPSKPKTKSSIFNWFGTTQEKAPDAPVIPASSKKAPSPGAWSPPLPRSKKDLASKSAESPAPQPHAQIQVQPSFSSISTAPTVKPYWSEWKQSKPYEDVAEDDRVSSKEGSHGTRRSRSSISTRYSHKVSRPKYMDTHDHPYAVFVFNYRDKDVIEQMVNTSIIEREVDEKQRLSALPKSQLVEELMKAKSQQGSSNEASNSRHSSDKVTYKSNPHGVPLGPDVGALSERLSKLESSKAPTPEKVGGWLESAHHTANRSVNSDSGEDAGGAWGAKVNNDDNGGAGSWNFGGFNNTSNSNGDQDRVSTRDNKKEKNDTYTWGTNDNKTGSEATWHTAGTNKKSSPTPSHNDEENDGWGTTGFGGMDTSWGDPSNKDNTNNDNHNDNNASGDADYSWDNGTGGGGVSGW